MESRSVGCGSSSRRGTYFGIGGNDGPYGVDRRWIVAGGWAGRATYAVGKIQQTAETAFFHMGLNTYAGGYRVVLDGNGHEKTLNPGSAGNELPQYPAGWGRNSRAGSRSRSTGRTCAARAGFDTTEPYFASITDAGAEKACVGRRSSRLDANAQAHGQRAGKLILYFGAQHVDDWDDAAAFETLPEGSATTSSGKCSTRSTARHARTAWCWTPPAGQRPPAPSTARPSRSRAAGIRAGVELWPSAADGQATPSRMGALGRRSERGRVHAGGVVAEVGPSATVILHAARTGQGDLYLLGSSVSAGGFVGGSMIYNPGSGDSGYAGYIAARNAQITECSKYGVGMILMDSDWTHSGLKAAGVII